MTREDILEEVRRLEMLAHDLRIVADNLPPTTASLLAAPLLENWKPTTRPAACLMGEVTDHPTMGNIKRVRTSELYVLDIERGLARTGSRWYRLGARSRGVSPDPRFVDDILPEA